MNQAYSFDDVLIVPQYSEIESRSECDVTPHLPGMDLRIPIFAANMDTICGLKMATKMDKLGGCGIIHRFMKESKVHNIFREWANDEERTNRVVVAVGSVHHDKRRIDIVCDTKNIDICIDLAHGDSKHMVDTLKYIRKEKQFSGIVIAGNVCTHTGASRLFNFGADIVKVGVGPGSACTTRGKTGCGYPQLAAIEKCSKAGPIIADGGIREASDVAKAISVGAHAVMIGGLLAGTDCTPYWDNENQTVDFRGMASEGARKACGQVPMNIEGDSFEVVKEPKGSTQEVVEELVEGLRSAMSYSGCRTLEEFRTKSQIVLTTPSIVKENRSWLGKR
jgi:IMP dehydrogenase/GMP reductase